MQHVLAFVEKAVQEASQLLLDEGKRPGGPRGSGMTAPVDSEIGAFLTRRLGTEYPDATIVCEEGGSQKGDGKRVFYIDPNDGTRDFLEGYRENSIAVGLIEDGQHKVSVVYAPFSTELTGPHGMLVTWAEGEPLRHNGEVVDLPPQEDHLTDRSVVLISTRVIGKALATNEQLLAPARLQACSSIATRLALVAIGKASAGGTILNPLRPWDYAAAQGLLQAAGGDLVGNEGKPIAWKGIETIEPPQTIYFGARNTALAIEVVHRMDPLLTA